jgi:hypothetical protein
MTDILTDTADKVTSTIESSVDSLKHESIYYTVAGIGAAFIVGAAFSRIPFDRIGAAGNIVRTGTLLIGGPAVIAMGKDKDSATKNFYTVLGGLITGVGFVDVLGYFNVPGFSTLAGWLRGGSSSFGSEFVAQPDGDGRVLGQVGATYDTRAIVETGELVEDDQSFVYATQEMADRYAPQESVPLDSVVEGSTMAGTITQNFGADTTSTGYQAPSDLGLNDFTAATDALAMGTMDKRSNPFVASITPVTPSYQPPVWYAEDVPTIAADAPVTKSEYVGGMEDIWGSYIRPGSTGFAESENPFVLSASYPSAGGSGHGVSFDFGSEGGF